MPLAQRSCLDLLSLTVYQRAQSQARLAASYRTVCSLLHVYPTSFHEYHSYTWNDFPNLCIRPPSKVVSGPPGGEVGPRRAHLGLFLDTHLFIHSLSKLLATIKKRLDGDAF
ncbi:hypothetical protein EW146_g1311 [Bondarzewia mesenterica]|uniref:Uncharacterized protein n=1 Tax=Bondarzewia mesenterica TaxID=1095465 RepID=A0A4S4M4A6_9AGAM|nr:hypothetical protein EW146_g1311 [Bondarzewia mesenterica]